MHKLFSAELIFLKQPETIRFFFFFLKGCFVQQPKYWIMFHIKEKEEAFYFNINLFQYLFGESAHF